MSGRGKVLLTLHDELGIIQNTVEHLVKLPDMHVFIGNGSVTKWLDGLVIPCLAVLKNDRIHVALYTAVFLALWPVTRLHIVVVLGIVRQFIEHFAEFVDMKLHIVVVLAAVFLVLKFSESKKAKGYTFIEKGYVIFVDAVGFTALHTVAEALIGEGTTRSSLARYVCLVRLLTLLSDYALMVNLTEQPVDFYLFEDDILQAMRFDINVICRLPAHAEDATMAAQPTSSARSALHAMSKEVQPYSGDEANMRSPSAGDLVKVIAGGDKCATGSADLKELIQFVTDGHVSQQDSTSSTQQFSQVASSYAHTEVVTDTSSRFPAEALLRAPGASIYGELVLAFSTPIV